MGLPTFGPNLKMRATAAGYTVSIVNNFGATFHLVDVREGTSSGGSTTSYWQVYERGQGFGFIDKPVEECQRG